jgi:hypothetical protein
VNQESATGFESNNYILAAAIESNDALRLELGRHLGGVEWAGQPRIEYLDTLEAAADKHGLEPAADGLDLGQFGHAVQPNRAKVRVVCSGQSCGG